MTRVCLIEWSENDASVFNDMSCNELKMNLFCRRNANLRLIYDLEIDHFWCTRVWRSFPFWKSTISDAEARIWRSISDAETRIWGSLPARSAGALARARCWAWGRKKKNRRRLRPIWNELKMTRVCLMKWAEKFAVHDDSSVNFRETSQKGQRVPRSWYIELRCFLKNVEISNKIFPELISKIFYFSNV